MMMQSNWIRSIIFFKGRWIGENEFLLSTLFMVAEPKKRFEKVIKIKHNNEIKYVNHIVYKYLI